VQSWPVPADELAPTELSESMLLVAETLSSWLCCILKGVYPPPLWLPSVGATCIVCLQNREVRAQK
jgi:hypothetical protein